MQIHFFIRSVYIELHISRILYVYEHNYNLCCVVVNDVICAWLDVIRNAELAWDNHRNDAHPKRCGVHNLYAKHERVEDPSGSDTNDLCITFLRRGSAEHYWTWNQTVVLRTTAYCRNWIPASIQHTLKHIQIKSKIILSPNSSTLSAHLYACKQYKQNCIQTIVPIPRR